MTFGMIGAGDVAQTLSRHLTRHGHEVVLSNGRGPASLTQLAARLGPGVSAGAAEEAAQQDFVVLCVPWAKREEALGQISDWSGRVLVDATNHILSTAPLKLGDLSGKTSSEIISALAPGARVVKAFNNIPMSWIKDVNGENPRPVLFTSGDDHEAKGALKALIEGLGFPCVDLGGLAAGGALQQVGGSLNGLNLQLVGRVHL